MENSKYIISNANALKFMLGGNSEFTMHSLKTGNDLTYKLIRLETNRVFHKRMDNNVFIYFMSYSIGYGKYEYGGVIYYNDKTNQFYFKKGYKGFAKEESQVAKSIIFVLNKFHKNRFNIPIEIYHHCKCGRCGRRLTKTGSIITGLGEKCARKVQIPYARINTKIS
jgi:hypothetical protein